MQTTEQKEAPRWPRIFTYFFILAVIGSLLPSFRTLLGDHPNLYAMQGRAFWHGHLGLERRYHDTAFSNQEYHVVNPPFPSLVLLPFAAVLPERFDFYLALGVSLGLAFLSWRTFGSILRRLNAPPIALRWLPLGFFFGTGYWMCLAACNAMWFFAHIVAIAWLLLAVKEALQAGRGWLVGLLLGGAFLSRQVMIHAFVFLLVVLWQKGVKGRWHRLAGLVGGLGVCVAAYLAFNYARFGNPFETGYNLLEQSGYLGWRQSHYGMFHPIYIPVNFIHMFLQGFHVEFAPPSLLTHWEMNPFGTSLTFASPFLFLAWRGRLADKPMNVALWLSIGMMLVHCLMYHTNGWKQSNAYRYSLDFVPLVAILAARGAGSCQEGWCKWLVVYAIVLNCLALFWLPLMGSVYEGFVIQ
jgi:hypothetical protein